MSDARERKTNWILGGIGLGSYVCLLSLELATETDDIQAADVLVDALTLFLTITAAVGMAVLVQRIHKDHEEKLALIRDLETARAEGRSWRSKNRKHLNGLKIEMEKQFEDWGMTTAERDVGLLILKGLSHKEIASLRGTSEATVRQQAGSIYAKAKLPGKTAFSAFFLEDLVEPDQSEEAVGTRLLQDSSRTLQ